MNFRIDTTVNYNHWNQELYNKQKNNFENPLNSSNKPIKIKKIDEETLKKINLENEKKVRIREARLKEERDARLKEEQEKNTIKYLEKKLALLEKQLKKQQEKNRKRERYI